MAVERDSSYSAHAPADTRELVDELRSAGIKVADPVWTIGRLDERRVAQNGNGNGNGAHHPEDDATDPSDQTNGP